MAYAEVPDRNSSSPNTIAPDVTQLQHNITALKDGTNQIGDVTMDSTFTPRQWVDVNGADRILTLPSANVKKGWTYEIANPSKDYALTVNAYASGTVWKFWEGSLMVRANQDTPTLAAHWDVLNKWTAPVCARYTADGVNQQSIPSGVETIRDWPTKDVDTHNAVITGATWSFTVPKDGVYVINPLTLVQGPYDYAAWELIVDGTDISESWWAGNTVIGLTQQSTFIKTFTKGQVIQLKIFHNAASGLAGETVARNSIAITKLADL